MKSSSSKGFTLIELIIAVVIIAILASIAYPSYLDYVRRSRRTDAITILLDLQQKQEKWRANHAIYGALTDLGAVSSSYYNFTADTPTATTYKLTATATGDQKKDTQNSKSCETLSIDQNNTKGTYPECWMK